MSLFGFFGLDGDWKRSASKLSVGAGNLRLENNSFWIFYFWNFDNSGIILSVNSGGSCAWFLKIYNLFF